MSKETAMAMVTGETNGVVNHSIITGQIPTNGAVPNPALDVTAPVENEAVKTVLESDAHALMARKEAKFVRERNEWKAAREKELAEIEDLKKKLRDPYDKIQAFEAKRKEDPVAALKEIGFSETEIFNFMAGQEKKEPTAEEIAKAAALEEITKFKEEQVKLTAEAQKARDESIISRHKTNIKESIEAAKDTYEYLAFNGAQGEELVYDTINQILKDSNELIDVKEAMEMVESYLEEQDKAMSVIKKRQPKAPEVEAKADSPVRTRTLTPPLAGQTPPAPSKTLTSRVVQTAQSAIPKKETHEQKKARLIDALKRGSL